ncbi:hypothetical protein SAMD00019534_124620, partial [Acytostelium subglobosum LB1]|uniref:hypothetical protein n=1 Tax=Acytostelium subglobosum LB1 TaxID=1410327 RepID=UPI00064484A1
KEGEEMTSEKPDQSILALGEEYEEEFEDDDEDEEHDDDDFEDEDEDEQDDEDDEDDENYEEMTEEQLDELNRLSSQIDDPFKSGPSLGGSKAPPAINTPAQPTGVWGNLSSFLQQTTSSESSSSSSQTTAPVIASSTTSANNNTDSKKDKTTTTGIEDQMAGLGLSHAKMTANHLIIDTNALIRSEARFDTLAKELWTVPEVLDEVTDKKTKAFIESFPFEIKTREPSPESMKAVVAFAQKTGDLASLSLVDLKVLALTHMIHAECEGLESIKTELQPTKPKFIPRPKKQQPQQQQQQQPKQPQQPKQKQQPQQKKDDKSTKVNGGHAACTHDHPHPIPATTSTPTQTQTHTPTETTTESTPTQTQTTETPTTATADAATTTTTSKKKGKKNSHLIVNMDNIKEDASKIVDPREVLEKMKKQKELEAAERQRLREANAPKDEGEWITP